MVLRKLCAGTALALKVSIDNPAACYHRRFSAISFGNKTMPNTLKAFVINLDRSPERMEGISKNLDALGIPFERVAAVDGSKLTEQEIAEHYCEALNKTLHYRPMKAGEVACYLSHRKVCQQILDSGLDYALVLEDDAELVPGSREFVEKAAASHQHWDIVKLYEGPNAKKAIDALKVTEQFSLTVTAKVPSGTVAQIISREGARKILAMSERFGRPIDQDIRHWWLHDLRVLGVSPTLVSHVGEESDIDAISGHRKVRDYSRLKRMKLKLAFSISSKFHAMPKQILDDIRS